MLWMHPPPLMGIHPSPSATRIATVHPPFSSSPKIEVRKESLNPTSACLDLPNGDPILTTGLAGSSVLVRQLRLDLLKESDIDSVLPLEAEPHLPFPVEQALLCRQVIQKSESGSLLTVTAAQEEELSRHLDFYRSQGIEPERVTAEPAALAAWSQLLPPSSHPRLLIHLGELSTSCTLVENQQLLGSLSQNVGTEQFMDLLRKQEHQSDQQARSSLEAPYLQWKQFPPLYKASKQLERWVQQALHSLIKFLPPSAKPEIYLIGPGSQVPSWASHLKAALGGSTPPLPDHPSLAAPLLAEYALPIGLALTGEQPGATCDFRQKDFASPHPFKRAQKPALLATVLTLLLTLLITLGGAQWVAKRERALSQNFSTLVKNLEQQGGSPSFSSLSPPTSSLTGWELQEQLKELQGRLTQTSVGFPLSSSAPKVQDFLSWLGSHPKVLSEEEALIQLYSFHYTLLKRPQKKKPKEPYQVKVDLEVEARSSRDAREFHDALLEPNPFIDPKLPLNWTAVQEGRYRASFYLKSLSPSSKVR